MEQIGTMNMTCGTSLGPLMHRVAQESITVEMSFEKSFGVWSSCGIPPTEWLDLLSMKKIAIITEDGNGYVEDPNYMGKDFQLMSMGWIKFHDRNILYDGYIARSLGKYSRAGFTPEQVNTLCKLFDVVPFNTLNFGIHGTQISKDKFLSMTDEEFEKVFS